MMDTTASGTIYVLTVEGAIRATLLFTRETEDRALNLFIRWVRLRASYIKHRIRLLKLDDVPGASHWERAEWVRENRLAMDNYRTCPALRVSINFGSPS